MAASGSDVDPVPPAADELGTARVVLVRSLELFADRGYHATSIRAIAEAVGIKSATLYDHFRSKPHIVARLVALGYEDVADRLTAAVDAPDAGSALRSGRSPGSPRPPPTRRSRRRAGSRGAA